MSFETKPIGDRRHGEPDTGVPLGVGGKARSANPTKVDSGDRVSFFADLVGRLVVVLNQVRELVTGQTTSLANGTETTIVTAVAATYNDLVLVACHNNSTAAITVSFRDVAAGTVRFMMTVPASDSRVLRFNIPLPQTTVNTAWTADMGDYTNTTITILAQAVQNV